MRILMTGGGTAGHINPALAIAAKLKNEYPDAEILFVGAAGRMETKLVPEAGFPIRCIEVRGFQRRLSLKNIGRNLSAAVHAVVHESNAFPGVTVKMLAKYATVLLANEAARKYLPEGSRAVVTGNPLRAHFVEPMDREQARRELGLDDRPLVLSFGGSLGADKINQTMAEVLRLSREDGRFQHIHGTGSRGWEATCRMLEEKGVPLKGEGIWVREYIDDMPRCMAAADLVVCRCGAMTLSELPAAGKPSILIPSPNVAENHQYHNAMALVNQGAAVCIEEKDLSAASLWETIERLAGDPQTLQTMAAQAKKAAIRDADERIFRVVDDLLKSGTK